MSTDNTVKIPCSVIIDADTDDVFLDTAFGLFPLGPDLPSGLDHLQHGDGDLYVSFTHTPGEPQTWTNPEVPPEIEIYQITYTPENTTTQPSVEIPTDNDWLDDNPLRPQLFNYSLHEYIWDLPEEGADEGY